VQNAVIEASGRILKTLLNEVHYGLVHQAPRFDERMDEKIGDSCQLVLHCPLDVLHAHLCTMFYQNCNHLEGPSQPLPPVRHLVILLLREQHRTLQQGALVSANGVDRSTNSHQRAYCANMPIPHCPNDWSLCILIPRFHQHRHCVCKHLGDFVVTTSGSPVKSAPPIFAFQRQINCWLANQQINHRDMPLAACEVDWCFSVHIRSIPVRVPFTQEHRRLCMPRHRDKVDGSIAVFVHDIQFGTQLAELLQSTNLAATGGCMQRILTIVVIRLAINVVSFIIHESPNVLLAIFSACQHQFHGA
jgi:hypothetical protein